MGAAGAPPPPPEFDLLAFWIQYRGLIIRVFTLLAVVLLVVFGYRFYVHMKETNSQSALAKAKTAEEQSGIIEMPAPVHHSNVMLLDPKSGRPTRLRARIDEDGTKERLAVKSGEAIPRTR